MYFTINMPLAHQLQTSFHKAILPEDFTSELTDIESSHPMYLKDFS